jgi:hypothetical protein
MPSHNAANGGQHRVGLRTPVVVGDVVQQVVDVLAADLEERAILPFRIHVVFELALDLALGAQRMRLDVSLDPVRGNFLE